MKKSSTKRGSILLYTLISCSVLIWIVSNLVFQLKSEIDFLNLKNRRNFEENELKNLEEVALLELNRGIKKVNNKQYKDIFHYFEGNESNWIKGTEINENGYSRIIALKNGEEVNKEIEIFKNYPKIDLNIFLEKNLKIDEEIFSIIVELKLEYFYPEENILKPSKKEIKNIEVKKYENS